MKKLVLIAGLVLAASVTIVPLAVAQAVPVPPTCSQALDELATARALPAGDVAAKQAALAEAKAAQTVLDKAVVDAQTALSVTLAAVPQVPANIAAAQTVLTNAGNLAGIGQGRVNAAIAALAAEQKLAADREAAIKAAQLAVDKACKGADGTVTTTPAVPTTSVTTPPSVLIPSAIDTGLAA